MLTSTWMMVQHKETSSLLSRLYKVQWCIQNVQFRWRQTHTANTESSTDRINLILAGPRVNIQNASLFLVILYDQRMVKMEGSSVRWKRHAPVISHLMDTCVLSSRQVQRGLKRHSHYLLEQFLGIQLVSHTFLWIYSPSQDMEDRPQLFSFKSQSITLIVHNRQNKESLVSWFEHLTARQSWVVKLGSTFTGCRQTPLSCHHGKADQHLSGTI